MASTAGQKRSAAQTKERAAAARGPSIDITVEGRLYSLTARDMSALDVRAMREQTGMSYNSLIATAMRDMDVDILAAIMWMSRRLNGEYDLTFAAVAGGVQWDVDWEFADDVEDEPADATPGEGDSPEA